MELIEAKLRRLRGWFIAWFVTETFIGIGVSMGVLGGLRHLGLPGLNSGMMDWMGLSVTLALFILAVLLGLALWVFEALLRLRNWARLVLLVVAWVSLVGAVTSFMGVGILGMVGIRLPGVDLGVLTVLSIVTNGLKLLFWSYVIATLQFDHEVLAGFHSGLPSTPCAS